jgi:DedD protein
MDESLKARLIGAAVLVAVAVLLIPELLSGRKTAEPQPADSAEARGSRTFTIELNGGNAAVDPQPPVAEAPARASVAVAEQPAAEPPAAAPAESGPELAPEREPVAPREPPAVAKASPAAPVQPPAETATAPAPVTRGGWAVQVGAFGSAAAAQRLVQDLQGAGYRAYVSPVTRSGKTLHRVRVGPEAGRDDANRLAGRLKGRGLPTAVVAND